jgi:peptidyl-prolyl cis-trans isomerase A (cyclophilin A)
MSETTPSPALESTTPIIVESTAPAALESSSPAALELGAANSGAFTLEDATVGLVGMGRLRATLETDLGNLRCELFENRAPLHVANFVGLARGLRAFKEVDGAWVKRPAYDGTIFHRVIRGFVIQGGDPTGTGRGEPGYAFKDEIWLGSTHDRRGQLCSANRGKNTNGMQFFITDGPAKHLDGGYTIFGECGPASVIAKIAAVEVRGFTDRPITPVRLKRVVVTRGDSREARSGG